MAPFGMAEFGFAQAPRGLADTRADLVNRIPDQTPPAPRDRAQCRLRRTCGLSREKAGISASKLSPATVAMV